MKKGILPILWIILSIAACTKDKADGFGGASDSVRTAYQALSDHEKDLIGQFTGTWLFDSTRIEIFREAAQDSFFTPPIRVPDTTVTYIFSKTNRYERTGASTLIHSQGYYFIHSGSDDTLLFTNGEQYIIAGKNATGFTLRSLSKHPAGGLLALTYLYYSRK